MLLAKVSLKSATLIPLAILLPLSVETGPFYLIAFSLFFNTFFLSNALH